MSAKHELADANSRLRETRDELGIFKTHLAQERQTSDALRAERDDLENKLSSANTAGTAIRTKARNRGIAFAIAVILLITVIASEILW